MKIVRPLQIINSVLSSSSVAEADYSAWSASTVYNTADRVTLISPAATATITIANPAVVTQASHGYANGALIVFTTTGALPTGIVSGTAYFIVNKTTNTYQLSLTSGGTALVSSGSQSGTHTATAQLHKVYESLVGSQSVVTMTIAAPCVVTWTAHGLTAGTPISFTTTGALPTGITANTVYYVLAPATDTFNVAATVGGAAITSSGTQSGVHTATAGANYNKQPMISTTQWLEVGNTNRWRCFDSSVTSQTSQVDSIVNVFATSGRIDSVALLNVNAASVTITQTDAIDGVVYNQTYSLVDDGGITDWYTWSFEPIVRVADKVITDMYPYSDAAVSVTLTDTGGTVLCGGMVLGQSKDISYLNATNGHVGVELGIKRGIQDYSVKQRDTFGNYMILERSFNKKADFTLFIDNPYVNALQDLLAGYRATPIVYVAAGNSTTPDSIIYGFYKDFSIDIAYHTKSVCTISLEGLT